MAEFGVKATTLVDPKGAGAVPVAGVRGAVEDTTLPSGLLNIAQEFALDYTKKAVKEESNSVLAALSGNLSSLSQAVETGAISSSAAATRSRAAVNRALANSGGNPDVAKAITDLGKSYFGMTNLAPALTAEEESIKREAAFNTAMINRLADNGFPVSPNPTQSELVAYKELDNSIQASKVKLQKDKDLFEFGAAQTRFSQEQANVILKNKTNEFISKNLEPSMGTLNTTAVSLKQQIAEGKTTPEAAMQQLTATSEFFRRQMLEISSGNPQYANDVISYLSNYTQTLQKSLDPSVTLEALQNRIKIQESSDRLLLMSNLDIRAAAAVTAITPNNVMLQQQFNPQMLAAVVPLALSFDPTKRNTQNINFSDPNIKTQVYQTAKTSIGAVIKEMNSPNGDKVNGPRHMDNMVNNLLSQGAVMAEDPTIKDTDAQDFVNFLATEEFKQWRQKGELNEQAMQGAQNMFSRVYLKQIQKRLIDKFEQPVDRMPPSSSSLVGAIVGEGKSPPLKYVDVFDVKFEGSSVVFVPRKIKGMDMMQQREVQNMLTQLEQSKKVINTAIRAGANVSRAENLQEYWDKNKQNILPYYFGAGSNSVKIGDIVNGKKYIGGSLKSKYSWEDVPNGGTN